MVVLDRSFMLNTPLGPAVCWAVSLGNAVERFVVFHTWQSETNEHWSWSNPDVRIAGSNTARRADWSTPIYLSEDRIAFLLPHIARHKQSPFYWRVTKKEPD